MSSRSSGDGPGRFSSGLCDIQHSAIAFSGLMTAISSLGQTQNVEECGAQLGRELRDASACYAPVGPQEQHGLGVRVEPRLERPGAVADDDALGVVVPGPTQLRQR